MVEPTLKTTSTPYDNQNRAEWRARVTTWLGIDAFSSLATLQQTEVDRLVDAAHEYVSKRLGHRPWMRRVATITLNAAESKFPMPADFRHLLELTEGTGSSEKRVKVRTQKEWLDRLPAAPTTHAHPWDQQNDPRWVYRGMDSSDPPVVVYERFPTPSASSTATAYYRPYHELMDAANFSELPPSSTEGIVAHLRSSHAAFAGQFETANFWRTVREDELAAGNINDNKENEDPINQELPLDFMWEMGIYEPYSDRTYWR